MTDTWNIYLGKVFIIIYISIWQEKILFMSLIDIFYNILLRYLYCKEIPLTICRIQAIQSKEILILKHISLYLNFKG